MSIPPTGSSSHKRAGRNNSPTLINLFFIFSYWEQCSRLQLQALWVPALRGGPTEARLIEQPITNMTPAPEGWEAQGCLVWCKVPWGSVALCVGNPCWPCNNHKKLLGCPSFCRWKPFLFSGASKQMRWQVVCRMVLACLESQKSLQRLKKRHKSKGLWLK